MVADMNKEEGTELKRTEWGVVLALAVSALNLAYTAGTLTSQVTDNTRRLTALESTMGETVKKIERIDANVQYLAERAKEDRTLMGRGKH